MSIPEQVRLWLPTPISVNEMFRNPMPGDRVKTRIKTREYEAWCRWASVEIMRQRPRKTVGMVTLDFFLGERSKLADCSNFIKGAEDLLVEMRLIEGDNAKTVRRVSIGWVPNYSGAVVHITPYRDYFAFWEGFDEGVLGAEATPAAVILKNQPQSAGRVRKKIIP